MGAGRLHRPDQGGHETILADHVFGCDGANSVARAAIGATMQDLSFARRRLVVDIATDADLAQGRACTRSATASASRPTCASARPATAGSSDWPPVRPPTITATCPGCTP